LSIWRKNVELDFNPDGYDEDDDSDEDYDADEAEDGVLTGVGYMALLQSPEDSYQLKNHPFRKYKIQHWDLNLEDEEMLAFWTKVGPLMRHLSLHLCTFERVEDFRKILFELTPNLESLEFHGNKFPFDRPTEKAMRLDPTRKEHLKPENVLKSMKKLQVRWQPYFEYDHLDALPTTWIEFFVHFPNIEKIYVEHLADEELVECVQSMEIVRENLGSEYFAKLMQLDIAFGP